MKILTSHHTISNKYSSRDGQKSFVLTHFIGMFDTAPLELHSLKSSFLPFPFSAMTHFSYMAEQPNDRTNERTKNEAPLSAAELPPPPPRCSLGCLGNDLTCLPLSLPSSLTKRSNLFIRGCVNNVNTRATFPG